MFLSSLPTSTNIQRRYPEVGVEDFVRDLGIGIQPYGLDAERLERNLLASATKCIFTKVMLSL